MSVSQYLSVHFHIFSVRYLVFSAHFHIIPARFLIFSARFLKFCCRFPQLFYQFPHFSVSFQLSCYQIVNQGVHRPVDPSKVTVYSIIAILKTFHCHYSRPHGRIKDSLQLRTEQMDRTIYEKKGLINRDRPIDE